MRASHVSFRAIGFYVVTLSLMVLLFGLSILTWHLYAFFEGKFGRPFSLTIKLFYLDGISPYLVRY